LSKQSFKLEFLNALVTLVANSCFGFLDLSPFVLVSALCVVLDLAW
jgi:hypothetical protein